MMQSVELNIGPVGDFLVALKTSRDQVAAHPPQGFLYSRGGFVLGAVPPTFEVLTAWDEDKSEVGFR